MINSSGFDNAENDYPKIIVCIYSLSQTIVTDNLINMLQT